MEHRRLLSELGADVVAISVDSQPDANRIQTRLQFPFPVLSDPDARVVSMYAGTESERRQGRRVARPATYVLDRSGEIAWSSVGRDYSDRPLLEEVLDQIRRLPTVKSGSAGNHEVARNGVATSSSIAQSTSATFGPWSQGNDHSRATYAWYFRGLHVRWAPSSGD